MRARDCFTLIHTDTELKHTLFYLLVGRLPMRSCKGAHWHKKSWRKGATMSVDIDQILETYIILPVTVSQFLHFLFFSCFVVPYFDDTRTCESHQHTDVPFPNISICIIFPSVAAASTLATHGCLEFTPLQSIIHPDRFYHIHYEPVRSLDKSSP